MLKTSIQLNRRTNLNDVFDYEFIDSFVCFEYKVFKSNSNGQTPRYFPFNYFLSHNPVFNLNCFLDFFNFGNNPCGINHGYSIEAYYKCVHPFKDSSNVSERIYQGQILPEKETFKWFVKINLEKFRHRAPSFCSGTIIADQWIITASHCLEYNLFVSNCLKRCLSFTKHTLISDSLQRASTIWLLLRLLAKALEILPWKKCTMPQAVHRD